MAVTHALVGLGNPGLRYRNTRHNIGFRVLDELASMTDRIGQSRTKHAIRLKVRLTADHSVILVKPRTYMNRSGVAVAELIGEFNIPLSNLLVILDDFNLPFGKIRFRREGSAGGHNGLKSIIECLEDTSFSRLRLGLAQGIVADTVDFVLGKFTREEKRMLPETIHRSAEACVFFAENGIANTMNKYN